MIDHIFITIILYCFAITSNIKPIESAGKNQIYPLRFFVQTCHENYVRIVNNVKTFNNHSVIINPEDFGILTTGNSESIEEYQFKLKIRDKLEKKGQDIKCSFGVTAYSTILYLKNLVEMLKSGVPFFYNEDKIIRIKQEAEIIVHILLAADLETGKWLWSYFFKIIATRQYEDNKSFIRENPFEDDKLQTSVADFIENCMAKNYLPPTAMEPDFVVKNKSIHHNMFNDLREFLGFLLDRRYDNMINVFYLKPFWDDARQLLFRPISQANVDWSKAKQRHEVEVVITKQFVRNRTWIYKPYDRTDHQHLLINIIDARIYCHLSVVLYIYEKQLSILDEETLLHIKGLITGVIRKALKATGFKDDFLLIIISEFKLLTIRNVEDIKDILTRLRTKANGILNDLNGASTSGIDRLNFNVSERQLSTNDLIIRIIKEFEDYLTEFNEFLQSPYVSFLHFMDVIKISAAQYINT